MDCCDEDTRELITLKYCEPNIIEKLLFDMYGNYVLQKIISLSKEPLTTKYLSIIGPLMKKLNSYSFGQKLYNKLLSSFPSLSTYAGIKNDGGKNRKYKNKKNNVNINNNDINMNVINNNNFNNMYNKSNNNNLQIMNNQNNNKNFPNNQIFIPNFYIPFQLNNSLNNMNNMNNPNNNKIYLQNLIHNNFPMNFNNPNNMNNFMQFQQNMNNSGNNNMNNGSQIMFNFNNQ